jgi:hypothetical protein
MTETRDCQVTLYHPELEYKEGSETYEVVSAKFHRWADDVYRGDPHDLPITKALVELEDGTIALVPPERIKMK